MIHSNGVRFVLGLKRMTNTDTRIIGVFSSEPLALNFWKSSSNFMFLIEVLAIYSDLYGCCRRLTLKDHALGSRIGRLFFLL